MKLIRNVFFNEQREEKKLNLLDLADNELLTGQSRAAGGAASLHEARRLETPAAGASGSRRKRSGRG